MHSHLWTLSLCVVQVAADKTATVDPSSNWGTWEGWGVSLAWWAKTFGDRDDLAKLFFTKDSVSFNGQELPGLGFNIARYNAGASSNTTYDGASMVVSPNIQPSRQIDGYWLDWASSDASSSSWDWTRDANQRAMLQKAQANGADTFELFSNSPMWWMCNNHNPSGSPDGTTDNLQSWNYDSHAVYLANIAQHAHDSWGVTFQSVEAFNEPSSAYWSASGTQEGCHFDVDTMTTVIGHLDAELQSRNVPGFIAASDETSYDLAVSTWGTLTTAAKDAVTRINVHGYQGGGGRRDLLYDAAKQAGKRLWNSEYGDGDATGQSMYINMLLDFTWLHPTAWVYWQAIDIEGWGLVVGDNDAKTLGSASIKYFVLAQFTRHVTPGMRILSTPDGSTLAAYDAGAQRLVVVAATWDSAQTVTFDLTAFKTPGATGATVPRWSTDTAGSDRYVEYNDTKLSGGKFSAQFAKGQVQTFEVSGVVL